METYLFIKQPQPPKIKADDQLSPQNQSQKAIRKYIKTILLEVEFMKQYRPLIKEKNSIT